MQDFEKLGVFYLGREFDLKNKKPKESLLLYDSKDLVTHAVCVGMTGSGKTGLCIGLLEEAAIDGIPALIIDPKGDLSNMLLTFPGLSAAEFLPWVNADDAARKGVPVEQFAADQAELWRNGLAGWGQNADRIQKLRNAADVAIYTPGSTAGRPVSILKSFAAPPEEVLDDTEALTGRINATATSLLGLIGIDADPIKSREHILLATILGDAWKKGQDVDLATLIQHVQTPPVAKIGVLDIDTFLPAKDRAALAFAINNLLAAPGFSAWMEGEPLDVGALLHSPSGKPRHAIFSIAHLNDAERMFFVGLLLNQTLAWMRTQPGTSSLRAILYMDEIFGYFPPVANPPSKGPLLTLLKQARAFGLGIVLATQNPVDLDYKGLSNTGTWFIGRLQTERDKARVMEGLEGAAASQGGRFDRQAMEQTIAGLGNRVFLMNNVHEDAPVTFETRWTLSYLRGPLTRSQIKTLTGSARAQTPAQAPAAGKPGVARTASAAASRPSVPAEVPVYFVPVRNTPAAGQSLVYVPMLYGAGTVHLSDKRSGVETTLGVRALCAITNDPIPVDWERAEAASIEAADLEKESYEGAGFSELPPPAAKAKNYDGWSKDCANWVYRTQAVTVLRSPSSDVYSNPQEPERDFRARLQQSTRERRDGEVETLRKKYAGTIATLEERLRRARQAQEVQAEQAKSATVQTAISFGATLLGGLLGRKALSVGTLGRATTAARSVSRTMKESSDVARAKETVETVEQQLQELNAEIEAETGRLTSASDPVSEQLETLSIKPKKKDIDVQLVALVWVPFLKGQNQDVDPAY